MKSKISKVIPDSIAEELEIEVGDTLLAINGNEVNDIIDYKFLMADEYIEIDIEKPDGEVWSFEIEKEYEEDLGVEFENSIMDSAKSCCNNCVFCFIDQLPEGMRETLYFKDDDSRLSFLQGNFVTLTNMKESDIDRIIKYRISPINISVHTTNPDLRISMLNNRFAGNIYERLQKLAAAEIKMNCQVVSCPGINNGEELVKAVKDLYKLYPAIENVAVVPVGITKHREGLRPLKLYDEHSAKAEIESINVLQEQYMKALNTPFVRLSDEFYVTAKLDIPESKFYGEFDQLEDGVGMIRFLRDNIEKTIDCLNGKEKGSFTLITGVSAYEEISAVAQKIKNKNNNIEINVMKIRNEFFGETITVAGLITGIDIITQLKDEKVNEHVIIPSNMLKSREDIFLDDISLDELQSRLQRKVLVCNYTGEDLIQLINSALSGSLK